jgi:hypothetical protein
MQLCTKDNYVKYPGHSLWRGSLGSAVQQSECQTLVRSTSEKKVYIKTWNKFSVIFCDVSDIMIN